MRSLPPGQRLSRQRQVSRREGAALDSRRQFFGTLGKALGAGGLLLPLAGKGALALPADLGEAAQLPVKVAALPLSPEGLRLRELRRALHDIHLDPPAVYEGEGGRWWTTMMHHYGPTAHEVASRANPTWADCVELAEVIWHILPKERDIGPYQGDPTGALDPNDQMFGSSAHHVRHEIVALVEAVLTLCGGERFDPQTREGIWPRAVQAKPAIGGGRHHA